MAVGSIWRADNKIVVQFNQVKPKDKKIIKKAFEEWSPSGSGYHKDGTEVLIFSNKHIEEDKVIGLVKQMPFPFTQERHTGTSTKIHTNHTTEQKGLTSIKNPDKIRGSRTCSKCGVKGHNSRTCKG